MNITEKPSEIRRVVQGDPNFMIRDGLTLYSRAGMEITPECPRQYSRIIQECIHQGWLRPVAYVWEPELFWERVCT